MEHILEHFLDARSSSNGIKYNTFYVFIFGLIGDCTLPNQ